MKKTSRILVVLLSTLFAFTTLGVNNAEAVTYNSWPVVRQGQTSTQVTTVQHLLTAKGYSTTADGVFGSGTHSKVVSFQRANGLAADGIVGAATWGRLTNVTLRNGSTGSAVRALQVQLRRNGHSVTVDGVFGSGTLSAVRSFQSSKGLVVDGVVGPATWRGLIAGVSSSGGTTTRAGYARQIRDNGRITLLHFCGPSYASPRQNIVDTAAGRVAYTGGGHVGKRGVYLNTNMLRWMRDFGNSNSYRVTTILGCQHSATSRHYSGRAVDIDYANGVKISTTTAGRNMAAVIKNSCRAYGATEILGPGDAGHSGHVHCAW